MLLHRVPFRLHPRLFFWLRVGYGMDGRDCAARPDAGVLGWLLRPDRLWRGLARLASVTPVIPLVPSQLPVSLRHREAAPPAQEGAKLVREAEGVRRNVPGFRTMIRKKNAFIDKKNAFTDSITASSRQPTGRQGPQPRSRAAKS